MLPVRHVMRFRVGRDYQQWYAEAKLVRIVLRRRDVIVPAPPIVPRDENYGALPIRAFSDRVDDRCHPGRTSAVGDDGVSGRWARGRDPNDFGEPPLRDVAKDELWRRDDMGREFCAVTKMRNGIRSIPEACSRMGLVITPAQRLGLQQVHQRQAIKTRVHALILISDRIDQQYKRARRRIASPDRTSSGRKWIIGGTQVRTVGNR